MKERTIHSLKVFCMLSALLLLFAFSATVASAEFYVIAGSRGVGTEIKSLPYTISAPGFYYIRKNLTCVAGAHGITINTDNVTLDLMGFRIRGSGGTGIHDGIYMNGRSTVEIRNGTVRYFERCGIHEISSTGAGHRIINIRAKDNGSYGIYLYGRSNIVERCTAVGNGGYGIYAYSGTTVIGNTCYDNGEHGIIGGFGSTVTGNTCYGNGADGIYAGIGTTVTGNTCRGNTGYGIRLGGYNLVDQNSATSNTVGNMNACGDCEFGTNIGAP